MCITIYDDTTSNVINFAIKWESFNNLRATKVLHLNPFCKSTIQFLLSSF